MSRAAGWLRRKLPLGRFGNNVVLLAGGTALGQGLVLVSYPLLTRLFTPVDFGILSVYSSLLTILVTVASLRFELAISIPKEDGDAADILVLCGLLLILLTLVCLAMTGVSFLLGGLSRTKVLGYAAWFLPLGFAGAGLSQILNYWMVRKKAFGVIARTRISQGVWMIVCLISLGIFKWGAVGLIIGDIVGRVAGTATLLRPVLKEDLGLLRGVTANRVRAAFRRFGRFFYFGGPSAMLDIASLQLPALMLAWQYGPQVAGWFALAQRIMGIPLRLVGTAVGQVYLAESSKLAHTDVGKVRALFHTTSRRLLMYGVLPVLATGILGPFVFETVFGKGWREAGLFLLMLVPLTLGQFIISPLSQNAVIFGKQKQQFVGDVVRTTLAVVVLALPQVMRIHHHTVMVLYSLVMAGTSLGFFYFYRSIIPTAIPVPERE